MRDQVQVALVQLGLHSPCPARCGHLRIQFYADVPGRRRFPFFLVLFIGAGDILLDFALEDERFFELAIRCHALDIFEDTEFAPPQSVNGAGRRRVRRFATELRRLPSR